MIVWVFKKKAIIVFLIAFVCFMILIQAFIASDDELDELESKFPLEDYLFADSKEKAEIERLKAELESEKSQKDQNFLQIDNSLKQLQEQLNTQQKSNEPSLYQNLYDDKGNTIPLDNNGEPILHTRDGQRVFLDENAKPYTLDENNSKIALDKSIPIVSANGNPMSRDSEGRIIFKDSEGNNVYVEKDKKVTTDKNGNLTYEDNKGNYEIHDKNGNMIEKGNKIPLAPTKNPIPKLQGQEREKDLYLYDEDGNIVGDSVAVENQKFDPKLADSKQKNINSILASRFESEEVEKPKKKLEYGVDEFTNLDDKDEGSNEHKLLRTITADRMIPAFLVRPISSQLAGNVVAQVESNIYGAMGRVVLIPKGSRVIGFYQSNNKIGEYRLEVIWTRIITPHGINILLTNAKGADVKGYNGLVGEVHSRNFQRYGIPMTLSTLSNGLLLAVNAKTASANNQSDLSQAYMTAQILSGMRQDVSTIIQRIVQEQMKIQPIITIREGSRIFIAPSQDIFIPIPKNRETLARFFREESQITDEEENTNE